MPRGYRDWGRVEGGISGVGEMPTYTLLVDFIVSAGLSVEVMSIFNPSASGQIMTLQRAFMGVALRANDGNTGVSIELRRSASLGTGTTGTPVRMDQGDPASQMQVRLNLTAPAAAGDVITRVNTEWERRVALQPLRLVNYLQLVELYRHEPGTRKKPLTVNASSGLVVTIYPFDFDVALSGWFEWTESPA